MSLRMINTRGHRRQSSRNSNTQEQLLAVTSGKKRRRPSEEKSSKKSRDSHDKYCWRCHSPCQENKCSNCFRVFHSKCLTRSTQFDEHQVCSHCQQLSASKEITSSIADTDLSCLLMNAIESAFPKDKKENKPLIEWQPSADDSKLCRIVDYLYIYAKCKDRDGIQYQSPVELLEDVRWMYHNCVIIHGEKSPVTKAAKKVLDQFNREIEDMLDCYACYSRKNFNNLFFLELCDPPHPLIWAKVKFYPYWPAKCLRVVNGKAHVRFFYTHQMASVPLSNCLFLSTGTPLKKPDKKPISKEFKFALDELEAFMAIFVESYGEYPYECGNVQFHPIKAEGMMKALKKKKKSTNENLGTEDEFVDELSDVIDLTEEDNERVTAVDVLSTEDSQIPPPTDEVSQINVVDVSSVENPIIPFDRPVCEVGDLVLENQDHFQVNNAYNGQLLPGSHVAVCNDDMQRDGWLPQPFVSGLESGISISNIVCGSDVPSDAHSFVNLDLNLQDGRQEKKSSIKKFPLQGTTMTTCFVENTVHESSNVIQASSSQREEVMESTASEQDDLSDIEMIEPTPEELTTASRNRRKKEIISFVPEKVLQVILNKDPSAYAILKTANMLVQQLFIEFWGMANGFKNAPSVLSAQENKIAKLEEDVINLERELSSTRQNYEECLDTAKQNYEECLQNAALVLRSKQSQLNEEIRQLKEENENVKLQLKMLKEKESVNEAAQNDYKRQSFCSECLKRAKIFCCWNGSETVMYCSLECQGKHKDTHSRFCKSQIVQQPGEQSEAMASNVAVVSTYSVTRTVQHHVQSKMIPNDQNTNAPQMHSLQTERVVSTTTANKKTLGVTSRKSSMRKDGTF